VKCLNRYLQALRAIHELDFVDFEGLGREDVKLIYERLELQNRVEKQLAEGQLGRLSRYEWLFFFITSVGAFLLLFGLWKLLHRHELDVGSISALAGTITEFIAYTIRSHIKHIRKDLSLHQEKAEYLYTFLVAVDACERILSNKVRDSAYKQIAADLVDTTKKNK
jgi:hypothetical protein